MKPNRYMGIQAATVLADINVTVRMPRMKFIGRLIGSCPEVAPMAISLVTLPRKTPIFLRKMAGCPGPSLVINIGPANAPVS